MIYFWFMEAECSQIAVVVDNKEDQRMNEWSLWRGNIVNMNQLR